MNREQFSQMIERIAEQGIQGKLPYGTVFCFVAWNPETHEMHTWVENEQEPVALAELLEEGAHALRAPEHIRGGN
jgi:hypothetical protein